MDALDKKRKDELKQVLKDSIQFIETGKQRLAKVKASTEVGEGIKDFFKDFANKIEFIFEQNILKAEGKSYKDWSREDLLSMFKQLKKEFSMVSLDILQDKGKDEMIKIVSDLIEISEHLRDEMNELESKNQITEYIKDGVNLFTRKFIASMQGFLKAIKEE